MQDNGGYIIGEELARMGLPVQEAFTTAFHCLDNTAQEASDALSTMSRAFDAPPIEEDEDSFKVSYGDYLKKGTRKNKRAVFSKR